MISFENFKVEDGSPIYSQIVRYIKYGIVAGKIIDKDEMPSRRVLSALIGINPNTIQKAYRILEEEDIIKSHSGAKSVVTVCELQIQYIRARLLDEYVKDLIESMKLMEVSKEEAMRAIEATWQ